MDPSAINDPFAQYDDQRTFIKPAPGGRTMASPPTAPPLREDVSDVHAPDHGLNPLLALANRLLLSATQLRSTQHVADAGALRNVLAQGVREFESQARAAGIAPEKTMAGRYVLCTILDEAAAGTPWGGSGVWARHSLLTMFHNETWGGEKVFQLMARLAEKPEAHQDVLELIYCALALGFEGRYRAIDNGRAQLEAVRDKLAQILKQRRGDYAPALAQNWQVQSAQKRLSFQWLPLAAIGALAALLLLGVFLTQSFSLTGRSDPVFGQIVGLRLPPPVVTPPQPAPKPRLAQFLQSDIKGGLVEVRDDVDRSILTLRGDGLFAPGSDTLQDEHRALMERIGDALAQVSGNVLVTGHTDSRPLGRFARFPSNWHLSEARARSVRELLLARKVPAERIRAEGRADGEPIAPNDTPANRSMNRRIEVTLFASAGKS